MQLLCRNVDNDWYTVYIERYVLLYVGSKCNVSKSADTNFEPLTILGVDLAFVASLAATQLTQWGRVTHMCVS